MNSIPNTYCRLSVVIPTRNEEAIIVRCIDSFREAVRDGLAEVIVVDNQSTDATVAQTRAAQAAVFSVGPERSAQRNFGAFSSARREFGLFLDADMSMPAVWAYKSLVGLLFLRCRLNLLDPPVQDAPRA